MSYTNDSLLESSFGPVCVLLHVHVLHKRFTIGVVFRISLCRTTCSCPTQTIHYWSRLSDQFVSYYMFMSYTNDSLLESSFGSVCVVLHVHVLHKRFTIGVVFLISLCLTTCSCPTQTHHTTHESNPDEICLKCFNRRYPECRTVNSQMANMSIIGRSFHQI